MFSNLIGFYIAFITFTSSHGSFFNKAPLVQPWPLVPQQQAVSSREIPVTATITSVAKPVIPVKIVTLPVPLRHQIYTLSCEAASLQMVLEYKGITKTQNELLGEFGISEPYKSYIQNETMIWGDPNLGFVGNVNGYFSTPDSGMRGATGWGVNKDPVARVAKMYLPQSEAQTGFTTTDVIRELDAGNPVIFWHVPDSYLSRNINYQTPAGKTIKFFRNHVAVISGYKIVDGETSFIITDPLYGVYPLRKSTLERRMAKYDGDVVVIR